MDDATTMSQETEQDVRIDVAFGDQENYLVPQQAEIGPKKEKKSSKKRSLAPKKVKSESKKRKVISKKEKVTPVKRNLRSKAKGMKTLVVKATGKADKEKKSKKGVTKKAKV